MINKRASFKKKTIRPETLHGLFLRWLNWLLKDSNWRAYIRTKLKENELPVIDFTGEEKRHVAK